MMKAYLYYSKSIIKNINAVEHVRASIAELLTEKLNKFVDVRPEDVFLCPASISGGADIILVIDDVISLSTDKETVRRNMSDLKAHILDIIRLDQGTEYNYKVKTKFEPGHAQKRAQNKEDKKAIELKDRHMEEKKISKEHQEFDYEQRSRLFYPKEPNYSFDRVFLSEEVIRKIEEALATLECEKKVFGDWGLYEIQPFPASSLNFFGPPGTGKSMAAEAIAQKLGKKILRVTYADVESKYHGEGPKMVKAIFMAAQREDAVLFFDEADSLLSKRLTNTNDGTAQAINSMRSQLTTCLDSYRGIVIFATNLIVNYDQAFLTRLISVEFQHPDVETRKKIWDGHIMSPDDGNEHRLNIPLANDVDTLSLAEKYDFVGREIRNAVISACIRVAMDKRDIVEQSDFEGACERILAEQVSVAAAKDHTVKESAKKAVVEALINKAKGAEEQNVFETAE